MCVCWPAPEVCAGNWYGHSVDWWSLGVIAYSLVVGRYPVPVQLNHTHMLQAISKYGRSQASNIIPVLITAYLTYGHGLLNSKTRV